MKVIKQVFNFCLVVMLIAFSGCGKKKIEAGSPEEVLALLKENSRTSTVFDFYTDDTIKLMKKYISLSGMKQESAVKILGFIPENSEYTVTVTAIDGKNCSMNLMFTKHSSENAVGLPIAINMVKEGKAWKIDRKRDFEKLIESFENKGAEDYLKKIR